jgi:hypothetical protein
VTQLGVPFPKKGFHKRLTTSPMTETGSKNLKMVRRAVAPPPQPCIGTKVLSHATMSPTIQSEIDGNKLPLSTKRLVGLYSYFSETPGLSIGKLNRELERVCKILRAPEPKKYDFKPATVSAWKEKLATDPMHTLLRPRVFAEACLLAFGEDITAERVFHKKPLSLNKIVELGPISLRRSQRNISSEDDVCPHDIVISYLKLAVQSFVLIPPQGGRPIGSLRFTPQRVTIEFLIDGLEALPSSDELDVVRGTVRPQFVQLLEGNHENGGFLGQCSIERTEKLTTFSVSRKFDASEEASAILTGIVPLSVDIGPDDEVTARVLIAEDGLEPTSFTSADRDDWNKQKSTIFERFFKLEASSDERLVAIAKAGPSQ